MRDNINQRAIVVRHPTTGSYLLVTGPLIAGDTFTYAPLSTNVFDVGLSIVKVAANQGADPRNAANLASQLEAIPFLTEDGVFVPPKADIRQVEFDKFIAVIDGMGQYDVSLTAPGHVQKLIESSHNVHLMNFQAEMRRRYPTRELPPGPYEISMSFQAPCSVPESTQNHNLVKAGTRPIVLSASEAPRPIQNLKDDAPRPGKFDCDLDRDTYEDARMRFLRWRTPNIRGGFCIGLDSGWLVDVHSEFAQAFSDSPIVVFDPELRQRFPNHNGIERPIAQVLVPPTPEDQFENHASTFLGKKVQMVASSGFPSLIIPETIVPRGVFEYSTEWGPVRTARLSVAAWLELEKVVETRIGKNGVPIRVTSLDLPLDGINRVLTRGQHLVDSSLSVDTHQITLE